MSGEASLYIVATPIGHLEDITLRALRIFKEVDWIAAEDTRHTRKLLSHYQVLKPCFALHQHNEAQRISQILARLASGQSGALVSDAGTPLISDPGYRLLCAVQEAGYKVSPIPGPCALIAALSVAGLPTERFVFEGFLPSKASAREKVLEHLKDERRTLVFYEAPHRILETIEHISMIFGPEREAVILRELTKTFETVYKASLEKLSRWLKTDPQQQRGEIVLIVSGVSVAVLPHQAEARRIVELLSMELPPKQAAKLASVITGVDKKHLYQYLLKA